MMKEYGVLWANVLINKYIGGERDVKTISAMDGASNAWRGVVEGAGALWKG